MTRLYTREQVARVLLISAFLISKACSSRDITDVFITEDGVAQILLPEKNCDFQIDVLTISYEQIFRSKTLRVRECTTIVEVGELRGEGILTRVPTKQSDTEVIYTLLTKRPSETTKDICRDEVDEAVELHTPIVHGHPAKVYISDDYSWPSRTQLCNDEMIQPTSCSNVSCSVSTCISFPIPEKEFLYTAYHEEICNNDSNNNICRAIYRHFNGTQWYRQDVARHCVVVSDAEQCLPNCITLYNATESSAVHCNFTTGQCSPLPNQTSSAVTVPSKPTRPSLYNRSYKSLTLSFSVKFGSAKIDYYLLKIINVTDENYSNQNNTTDCGYILVNITSGDFSYLTQEKQIVEGEGEEEEVVGYEVRLKVRDLEHGQEYGFAVAAGSAVGVGDFSDPSDPYSLESDTTTPYNSSIAIGVIVGVLATVLVVGVVVGLVLVGIKICRGIRKSENKE